MYPTIELNGVEYALENDVLRRCDKPSQTIPLELLKDEGEYFTVKFVKGTDNQLAGNGMYPFGSLIECPIPWTFLNQPEIDTQN